MLSHFLFGVWLDLFFECRAIVQPDGSLIYKDQPITDKELIAEFKKKASDKTYQVQIHADKKAEYGRIAEIMALAQSNGVTKLSFVTLSGTSAKK